MEPTVERVLARRAQLDRDPRALGRTTAVALTVHVLLAVVVWLAPRWGEQAPEPLRFVPIQVLPAAALGERRPAPPPPRPPASEPVPVAPAPKPEEKEPVPKPPEKEPAPAVKPTAPPDQPRDKAPAKPAPPDTAPAPAPKPGPASPTSPTGPVAPAGTPDGSALGTSRLGYQVVGVDNATFPFGFYLEQVLTKIDDNWVRPPDEGLRAVVFFRILRDGRVADLELKEPSGQRAFDLSALRAVTNASPLPPLPIAFREPALGVHLIVR